MMQTDICGGLEMDISVQRHARAHNKMNSREKSNLFVSVQEAQQFEKHTCVRFMCVWRLWQEADGHV